MTARVNRLGGSFNLDDWEKAVRYTDDSKADSVENTLTAYRQAQARRTHIRLGMKIGYSAFNTTSTNHVYITGIEFNNQTFDEEMVNAPGSIYLTDTRESFEVPNQSLYVADLPRQHTGYIAWDNTQKELSLIWHETTYSVDSIQTTRWRKANGDTLNLNQSVFILGELTHT